MSKNKSASISDAVFVSSCQKVSSAEYEQQKTDTHSALADLLDSIIHNESLSDKEKKAKLKMVSWVACLYTLLSDPSCERNNHHLPPSLPSSFQNSTLTYMLLNLAQLLSNTDLFALFVLCVPVHPLYCPVCLCCQCAVIYCNVFCF